MGLDRERRAASSSRDPLCVSAIIIICGIDDLQRCASAVCEITFYKGETDLAGVECHESSAIKEHADFVILRKTVEKCCLFVNFSSITRHE